MNIDSGIAKALIGMAVALSIFTVGHFIMVKIVKPKKLWWFVPCIIFASLFFLLAFWVAPINYGNIYLAGAQWSSFGLAIYCLDQARKFWPKSW
jgi:hypothetical protein